MGYFTADELRLMDYYKRAAREAGGFVYPRDYPYLDREIAMFARQRGCTYDEAFLFAKTGKKFGRLAD